MGRATRRSVLRTTASAIAVTIGGCSSTDGHNRLVTTKTTIRGTPGATIEDVTPRLSGGGRFETLLEVQFRYAGLSHPPELTVQVADGQTLYEERQSTQQPATISLPVTDLKNGGSYMITITGDGQQLATKQVQYSGFDIEIERTNLEQIELGATGLMEEFPKLLLTNTGDLPAYLHNLRATVGSTPLQAGFLATGGDLPDKKLVASQNRLDLGWHHRTEVAVDTSQEGDYSGGKMRESPIKVTLTVQLVLTIDSSEQYPLAVLSELLSEQNITSILVESLVECLNDCLVEKYCGTKHTHGNGNKRFQRAATCTRTAVTTAGEHCFTLDYVEDTAASEDEQSHFRPVEDLIEFDGKKRYQEDISARVVDLATTLSYRDAASAGDGFEKTPSPDTIQRRVTEYGTKLSTFVSDRIAGTEADTVIPDGTKCHSQDDDRVHHEVQLTLAEDDDRDSRSVLDVSVNGTWDEIAADLDEADAITDEAAVVSDGERCLVTGFTEETRTHQRDLVHVPRSLRHRLSVDGALALETRKGIVSEVRDELLHLKNSVEKHRPEEEYSAIRERIARTRERIEKTTWQLEQFGSEKAAAYLRQGLPSMLTFAEKALDGIEVRWTSNPVERAMGEVAKRCKRDWMQWSQEGLEAVLQLRLVDYQDSEIYRQFFDELLCRSTHNRIRCSVSATATGGEV